MLPAQIIKPGQILAKFIGANFGLIVLAWALSQLVRLALSRSREYLADAGSVELTKNPDAMISALRKIEGRGELPGATSAVMELCVDNPREGFADLFATHPSVEARVQALVKFAGGHYEGPLALPVPASEAEDGQIDQQPPPLPSGPSAGPWSDASNEGGNQAGSAPAHSPWGHAAGNPAGNPADSPAGSPSGPWGPR